ncbi:MAG: Sporulation initiation inhibitor protein Soj [Myxococcota bacterium]|nr:Sporulation initiation inhibitor protein Soj [Myxococcota bacterium]
MAVTIAIANQKGGCGKTTSTINLGHCLAEAGKKVLLVDLDPQSHLSLGLQVNPMEQRSTVYNVLVQDDFQTREAIVKVREHLDLIPSTLDLAGAEIELSNKIARENRLKRSLAQVDGQYDYILLDCPPALGILTINGLCACQQLLIVIETSYFALHGVSKLLQVAKAIQSNFGNTITVRAMATMYDRRNNLDNDVLDEIRKQFGERAMKTVVRRSVKLKEASSAGVPIGEYDRSSTGYVDYSQLTEELLEATAPTAARAGETTEPVTATPAAV